MKYSMHKLVALLVVFVFLAVLAAGCSGSESAASPEASGETSADASTDETAEASEEGSESEESAAEESAGAEESAQSAEGAAGDAQLPREETLYYAGQQWGAVNDYNPLSGNSNNAMTIADIPATRILIYETLMMFDPLTLEYHPLLATDYAWNEGNTELTVHLNPDAKWSDGTKFTAEDVAYTWEANKKYNSSKYGMYQPFIDTVEAVDEETVVIKVALDAEGIPVNYLYGERYITDMLQQQKAYLQKIEQECGEDPDKVTTARMEDCVSTGPYRPHIANDQQVVFIRDDNYWGQAESMWGKLPVPKYIAHTIYKDNSAADTALRQNEVDISQTFTSNVQDLWEKDGLDISTWLDEPPYMYPMQTPTAFFNCKRPGLDNPVVRKAIAMAVDFDQIIASAMSGQSPSFTDYPRCVAPPNDPVREKYIDFSQIQDLQFAGGDVEGAKKLLDDAGIVDSDGDGFRDIDGQKLTFKAEAPKGWSDWNAALEIVAAAGQAIGIDITTYFPDTTVYNSDMTEHNFDICMWGGPALTCLSPYDTAMFYMSRDYGELPVDWNGNFGQYSNDEVEEILAAIPLTQDEAQLKEYYTRLSQILLEDVPCFALMYRPGEFYIVNESVWTNYPAADDGRGIPPLECTDGWGIAGLYELELVDE